jgi:hypothetical protein
MVMFSFSIENRVKIGEYKVGKKQKRRNTPMQVQISKELLEKALAYIGILEDIGLSSLADDELRCEHDIDSYSDVASQILDVLNTEVQIEIRERIERYTPLGKIFAKYAGDIDYPGIELGFVNAEGHEQCTALIECTSHHPEAGNKSIRLMTWEDNDDDDCTRFITFVSKT